MNFREAQHLEELKVDLAARGVETTGSCGAPLLVRSAHRTLRIYVEVGALATEYVLLGADEEHRGNVWPSWRFADRVVELVKREQ